MLLNQNDAHGTVIKVFLRGTSENKKIKISFIKIYERNEKESSFRNRRMRRNAAFGKHSKSSGNGCC